MELKSFCRRRGEGGVRPATRGGKERSLPRGKSKGKKKAFAVQFHGGEKDIQASTFPEGGQEEEEGGKGAKTWKAAPGSPVGRGRRRLTRSYSITFKEKNEGLSKSMGGRGRKGERKKRTSTPGSRINFREKKKGKREKGCIPGILGDGEGGRKKEKACEEQHCRPDAWCSRCQRRGKRQFHNIL